MTPKPQPITRAYRADLAQRGTPLGPSANDWLGIGSLLEHAAAVVGEDASLAQGLVREACDRAEPLVSESQLEELRAREWQHRGDSALDALILLTDAVHDAGAARVAASILDGVVGAQPGLDVLTRGRIMARRARVAWRLGWLGEAHDRCTDLLALGEREHELELVARAWVGFAALAQMRGNYPEMERSARELEDVATRIGHRRLIRASQSSLMIVATLRKEFGRALQYAWTVYTGSLGVPLEEAGALQNLGQILLEAGYPDAARAAFARIISQALPARFLLPALGGLAVASARTGRPHGVLWASDQVDDFDAAVTPRYQLAAALLECAAACEIIGQPHKASAARTRAATLAETFNFHEIAYNAEGQTAAPPALEAPAATVAAEIVALEPEHLPHHVSLLPVG